MLVSHEHYHETFRSLTSGDDTAEIDDDDDDDNVMMMMMNH